MTNDRLSYLTTIEQHFQSARGTPSFRLTPVDFNLIDKWKKAGIPLEAVLRGIDRTFDNWRKRRRLAHNEMINSVAYCSHAIAVEAQAVANAAGKQAGPSVPPYTIEAVSKHVTAKASLLRKCGYEDLAISLDTIDVVAQFDDLEKLERQLTVIEDRMIARLHDSATDEVLFEARRSLDSDLKAYRNKMSRDQLAMLEQQLLDRRLLELAGLPRLSLFYF